VTYDIDANGILNVTAKDQATGREQKVTITASTNLDQKEIDRLVNESQQHKAEDERASELAEARNMADTVIYQVEKQTKDPGVQVAESLKSQIDDLRKAANGEDTNRIRQLTDNLKQSYEAMLRSQQANQNVDEQQPGNNGRHPEDEGENVVEGEFREE
jgi:molecular chaperone DnaK